MRLMSENSPTNKTKTADVTSRTIFSYQQHRSQRSFILSPSHRYVSFRQQTTMKAPMTTTRPTKPHSWTCSVLEQKTKKMTYIGEYEKKECESERARERDMAHVSRLTCDVIQTGKGTGGA